MLYTRTTMMYIYAALILLPIVSAVENRIVGGKEVLITEYPYQAALYLNHPDIKRYECGAVIVSPKYLLTAAFCVLRRANFYTVVIKESFVPNHYDEKFLKSRTYNIENKIIHPNFDITLQEDFDNNIAVLTVEGELDLNGKSSKFIPLSSDPTPAGSIAYVSGYGKTKYPSLELQYPPAPINKVYVPLKAADVPIVDHQLCVEYYKHYSSVLRVKENMICAGYPGGNGICLGDYGGPLVNNNTLIGLVSHGVSCGGDVPGVYVSIYKQRKFICRATFGDLGCDDNVEPTD